MDKRPRMLEGYRVLDFTHFVAGPTCTRILGEMGADVIKVERSLEGDHVRVLGLVRDGMSTYYFQHNHSKLSLGVNLRDPRGRELLLKMIPKIDVVVENFAPGVIAEMGFGYEALKKINPRIIMCSVSVAGQTGPLSYKPGYDYLGAALAGITDQLGEPEGSPIVPPMAIGDVSTGVAAAMAVGFALLHRERTGEGQMLDASLLDTYFHMHELSVPVVSLRPGKFVPKRGGATHPTGAPCGVYKASDGYVFLVVQQHEIARLWRAMKRPELGDDPRFKTNRDRLKNNLVAARDDRELAPELSRARRRDRPARRRTRPVRARVQARGVDGASPFTRAQDCAPREGRNDGRVRHPRDAGQVFGVARSHRGQGLAHGRRQRGDRDRSRGPVRGGGRGAHARRRPDRGARTSASGVLTC